MVNLDHIDPGNAGGSVRIPDVADFVSQPVIYHCLDCERKFDDLELLRVHRLDEHPIERPYLYIRNKANALATYVITKELSPHDIIFEDVESIYINNKYFGDLDLATQTICNNQKGHKKIVLENRGYKVSYRIDFNIISDAVASQVENAFVEAHKVSVSLVEFLHYFNVKVNLLDRSALGYGAALDRYLVGIMAKDRVKGCQVPLEEYTEMLGESLDRLGYISRPFGEAMMSIIQLMFNNFDFSHSDNNMPFIKGTKTTLREGKFLDFSGVWEESAGIPVDKITEFVMLFATSGNEYRHINLPKLENLTSEISVSEVDKLKLHLLLLAYYKENGNLENAREHFSIIRHDRQVGKYAHSIYGSSDNE
jgi:hypothetical protein